MKHGDGVVALATVASDHRWASLAPVVRERALASVADWFAVTLVGAGEPSVVALEATVATANEHDRRSAQLVRFGRRVSVGDAALINAVAGHVLDYDDTSVGSLEGHPTAIVLPGLLALADSCDLTLDQVLESYVAGVNVASRLGDWVNSAHYAAGWHATATVGSVGAAAAAGRLIGLDADALANAISLSVTQAGGLRASFGSMAKSLQVGRASTSAMFCALAAAAGSDAPVDPLSGNPSFPKLDTDAYSSRADGDATELTILKWHASCHGTHAALEGIEQLGVPNANVDWLEIGVREDLLDVCGIDSPTTPLELKFSLRGVAAMKLAGIDTSDPTRFEQNTLDAVGWMRALGRIRVVPAGLPSDWQSTVTIGTVDGQKVSATVDLRERLSANDLRSKARQKFHRLLAPVLSDDRTAELHDLLYGPGDVSIRRVMTVASRGER